ncbi:MAG: hypothetical protein EAZ55_03795 [Cytophagales bacterium]|nr:MAG: hypothetical protein EAZ55_03795 [Cytophagales bacterium]
MSYKAIYFRKLSVIPHKKISYEVQMYMLEKEKNRYKKELERLLQRKQYIEARLIDIEKEQQTLTQSFAQKLPIEKKWQKKTIQY